MICENCPCADICQARPAWCEWLRADSPDPVLPRHIRDASALGPINARPASYLPPELVTSRGMDDVIRSAMKEVSDLPPDSTKREGCCGGGTS
jgi:hypothetical protein